MAVPIESWVQVLGNTDDETAALILKLSIEDAEVTSDNATADTDFSCAKALWIQELKNYQAIRSPPTPPAQAPQEVTCFDCIICQDHFSADDCWQVPCQHYYCDDCLNDLFRVAITDEQAYPPRCCRQTVPFEDVQRYLDRTLADEFVGKKEELDDSKPTYCYVPTCSAYIGQHHKDDDIATCSK